MSDEKHVEKTRIELVYPRPGERIDCKETHNSFVIGEMIGEGNFSKVYSAIDVWGNDVAVKVLKPKRCTLLLRPNLPSIPHPTDIARPRGHTIPEHQTRGGASCPLVAGSVSASSHSYSPS